MNNRSKALAALIILLPVSAFALVAIDGFTVKRTVKEGQSQKFTIKGEFELAGTQATFTATDTEKVTKLDTDGVYTIETSRNEAKAVVNGQDIAIPDVPATSQVYNPDGSTKAITGDTGADPAMAFRLANLGAIIDSGKPLAVGDTWTADIKADSKTGAEAAKAEYKLVAEEKVGDIDTIKVHASVKETSGSGPASSDGDYWLDKGDASMVKALIKWTNVPFPGAPGPISGTLSINRLN